MILDDLHIIGANGFFGKALKCQTRDLPITLWSHSRKNNNFYFDIFDKNSWKEILSKKPKNVILLSWPGLPNYDDKFHITKNLPASLNLIEELVENGLEKILITGSCYEYGLLNGKISENQHTNPVNFYGIAKDTLRKVVELNMKHKNIKYFWLRIFYPYGLGQNQNSLVPSIINAINNREKEFYISLGHLKRDFIPVELVIKQILDTMINNIDSGIYNCGLGKPTSVFEIVNKVKKEFNSPIKIIEKGFPIRDNEPSSFWADMTKYNLSMNK